MPRKSDSTPAKMVLDQKLLGRIQNIFSSQGPLYPIKKSQLFWYEASYWRNPVMSPLFLQSSSVTFSDLKKISQSLAQSEIQSPHNYAGSYLCLLKDPYYSKKNHLIFSKSQWLKEKNKNSYLNVWTRPLVTSLPTGLSGRIGGYFDAEIYENLWKVLDLNFKTPSSFRKYLDLWHQQVKAHVKAVLIFDGKTPIAGGLVIQGQTGALLYCGAVNEKYRGQGLWNCLVSLRQAISGATKDPLWLMISQNPQIQKKGQQSWPIEVYYKNEII